MHLSPSMIPSVQEGAEVPFQSTSAMPQAVVQTPVQSGNLMGVPPDTLVSFSTRKHACSCSNPSSANSNCSYVNITSTSISKSISSNSC